MKLTRADYVIIVSRQSIPRVIEDPRKLLRGGGFWIRLQGMIRGGFLSAKERADLTALARNGLVEHRVARRANAILLLDKGWSWGQQRIFPKSYAKPIE